MASLGQCLLDNDKRLGGIGKQIFDRRVRGESWATIANDLNLKNPGNVRRVFLKETGISDFKAKGDDLIKLADGGLPDHIKPPAVKPDKPTTIKNIDADPPKVDPVPDPPKTTHKPDTGGSVPVENFGMRGHVDPDWLARNQADIDAWVADLKAAKAKPRTYSIKQVSSAQDTIDPNAAVNIRHSPRFDPMKLPDFDADPPIVLRIDDHLILYDGNHRAVAAYMKNIRLQRHFKAYEVDLTGKVESPRGKILNGKANELDASKGIDKHKVNITGPDAVDKNIVKGVSNHTDVDPPSPSAAKPLTTAQKAKIRDDIIIKRKLGMSVDEIVKETGQSKATVDKIIDAAVKKGKLRIDVDVPPAQLDIPASRKLKTKTEPDAFAQQAFARQLDRIKVDPETKRRFLEVNHVIKERYGAGVRMFEKVSNYPGTKDMSRAMAYARLGNVMGINPRSMLDHKIFSEMKQGWQAWGSGSTTDIIMHEFGHMLLQQNGTPFSFQVMQRAKIRAIDKAKQAFIDSKTGLRSKSVDEINNAWTRERNSMSRYGSTHKDEFEAELFMHYHMGGEQRPDWVIEWGRALHDDLGIDSTPIREYLEDTYK